MLLEPLLVGRLLGERDVSGEIGLELGLLGVCLTQPLHQLGITFI
jgi:hypothetical protein